MRGGWYKETFDAKISMLAVRKLKSHMWLSAEPKRTYWLALLQIGIEIGGRYGNKISITFKQEK